MSDGTNSSGKDRISGKEVATLAVLAIAGLSTIRWLLLHPEESKRIDMAILLGTQKLCLGISDGCRAIGDRFRYVADKAGTQFNNVRSG